MTFGGVLLIILTTKVNSNQEQPMFYFHWLVAFMDYNYQEHYWYAVKQRQFQNFVIDQLMKDVH